jgi:hypothetical protein
MNHHRQQGICASNGATVKLTTDTTPGRRQLVKSSTHRPRLGSAALVHGWHGLMCNNAAIAPQQPPLTRSIPQSPRQHRPQQLYHRPPSCHRNGLPLPAAVASNPASSPTAATGRRPASSDRIAGDQGGPP